MHVSRTHSPKTFGMDGFGFLLENPGLSGFLHRGLLLRRDILLHRGLVLRHGLVLHR